MAWERQQQTVGGPLNRGIGSFASESSRNCSNPFVIGAKHVWLELDSRPIVKPKKFPSSIIPEVRHGKNTKEVPLSPVLVLPKLPIIKVQKNSAHRQGSNSGIEWRPTTLQAIKFDRIRLRKYQSGKIGWHTSIALKFHNLNCK